MIKLGDIIKLRDSAFKDDFMQMGQNLKWNDRYLYDDQFKYIALNFTNINKTGEQLKTFFGSSKSKVIDIEFDEANNPSIVKTDLYIIVFQPAVKNKELTIINNAEDKQIQLNIKQCESELVEDLEFIEKIYLEGLLQINERENNKVDKYKLGVKKMLMAGKWNI